MKNYMIVQNPREPTGKLLALIRNLSKLLEIFTQKNKGPRIILKKQEFGLALPDIEIPGTIGYTQVK